MSVPTRDMHATRGRDLTRLEVVVANVLRLGVAISSTVMVVGAAVTLIEPSTERAARRSVAQLRHGSLHLSGLRIPHSVAAVAQGLGHGYGPAIAMLGLLLLIVTPVVRVGVSVVTFAYERDRTFVVLTVTVLMVLLGSFAVGT